MKIKTLPVEINDLSGMYGFIDDWYDLSGLTGIAPKSLAYTLKVKDSTEPGSAASMLRPWREGDRVGWFSTGTLLNVQTQLLPLIKSMYDAIGNVDHIWAYRSIDVKALLTENYVGKQWIVKWDIKKYFDNTTFRNIVETFKFLGATERGAKLLARFLTAKRPTGHPLMTLQQGAKTSPDVSNIVGHVLFDQYFLAWVEQKRAAHPDLEIHYARYSDNFIVSLDGVIPDSIIGELRQKVTEVLTGAGFGYHHWSAIPIDHPKRNQTFLGLVLNSVLRTDRDEHAKLKSTLFNAATRSVRDAAALYWTRNMFWQYEDIANKYGFDAEKMKNEKFLQILTGKVAYLKNINPDHHKELRKLLLATKMLWVMREQVYQDAPAPAEAEGEAQAETPSYALVLRPQIFEAVKRYSDASVTEEQFLDMLTAAIHRSGIALVLVHTKLAGTAFAKHADALIASIPGAAEEIAAIAAAFNRPAVASASTSNSPYRWSSTAAMSTANAA